MRRRSSPESLRRLDGVIAAGLSRRDFLRSAGIAAGAASLSVSFAPQARVKGGGNKTLVYVFLRGAMDGLSLVVPINSGTDAQLYRSKRSVTRLTIDDENAARRPMQLSSAFGLHPAATGFKQLWDEDSLAIVHAVGHLSPDTYTRSHFDAQEQIELGTPGVQTSPTGWLARYLDTSILVPGAVFNALSAAGSPPQSLLGWADAVTLSSTGSFRPNTGAGDVYLPTHMASLRNLYGGSEGLDVAAQAALNAVELVNEGIDFNGYVPGGGVTYPNTGIGNNLKLIATLMREEIGLSAATLDVGGWDTHNGQGVHEFGGYYNNVRDLSAALTAFYQDLAGSGFADRVAIVVQSEFGRQITENESQGTDHGLGNPMLVIGGGVAGGAFYGTFPGLAAAQTEGDAVRPTTDFRQVLATVVDRLMGNPNAEAIFDDPDAPFAYTPMTFA